MMQVFYSAPIPWSWIKQRPHFTAQYLAMMKNKVTYFHIISLRERLEMLISRRNYVKNKIGTGLFKIVQPLKLPKIPAGSMLNIDLRKKIRQEIGKDYDLVIYTSPNQYATLRDAGMDFGKARIVYDCMDYAPGFYADPIHRKKMMKLDSLLCSISDMIICSSETLAQKLIQDYSIAQTKVVVVNNGFDPAVFEHQNERSSPFKLRQPNLVFVGTIGDYIDIEGIRRISQVFPEMTIYLFGPFNREVRKTLYDRSNISLYGSVEHSEILGILTQSDLLMIPYRVTELIECVDPVKAYEYVAARKVFVSSYWKEMNRFRDFAVFYEPKVNGSLEKAVRKAAGLSIDESKASSFLKDSTWEERIKKFASLVKSLF